MSTLDSLVRYSVKSVMQLPLGDTVSEVMPLSEAMAVLFPDIHGFSGTIEIELTHIDQGVQVSTTIVAHGVMPCSRCTQGSEVQVDQTYNLTYSREKDVGDDLISPRDTIDLTQQCIDTVVPAIPDHVLCKEDCAGLCSACGVNLNDRPDHFTTHPEHHHADQSLGNSIRMK